MQLQNVSVMGRRLRFGVVGRCKVRGCPKQRHDKRKLRTIDIWEYHLPIALSTPVLFGLLGILANVAALGEVSRQMLLGGCSAISKTGMVLVVVLVRSSHLGCLSQYWSHRGITKNPQGG